MKNWIDNTNDKIDTNQSEVLNEMKLIGTRIDNLEEQMNIDRTNAKENLEKYISENKKIQESKDKETTDMINDVRAKVSELENLVKTMKDDERPMLPDITNPRPSYSASVLQLSVPQPIHPSPTQPNPIQPNPTLHSNPQGEN